jgi:hypothetical protein
MSAGSLAKLTPVSVVELEDPQGGDAPAHGELQHQESGMERNYSYTSLTGVARERTIILVGNGWPSVSPDSPARGISGGGMS